MENVDYVARAKRLMLRTARTAALVIMPLAATSSVVQAIVVAPSLPTGNLSCSASDSGLNSSCAGGASQLAPGTNGIAGVKLFTSGGVNFFSGGTAVLDLTTSGTLNGTGIASGTIIPLAYDFTIGTASGATVSSWSIQYQLFSGETLFGTEGNSGSGAGTFTSPGGASLTTTSLAPLGSTIAVDATLSVNWSNAGELTLTVPPNSIDFNALPSSTTPEPASLGLMGAGLALLGWRLARDRKRRWTLSRIRG